MRSRVLVFAFAVVLMFSLAMFAACGGNNDEPAPAAGTDGGDAADPGAADAGQQEAPEVREYRDLGGLQVVIGSWFDDNNTDIADPQTASERARWEDRAYLEQAHNFRVFARQMGGWGDVRDMIPLEIMARNDEVHIWIMEPSWFMTMHGQGLLAPLPMEYFGADSVINWNPSVLNLSMRDGVPHAFGMGTDFAGGIYFNMRLFEEAGLPRDYLFTLQREGRWDWDAFNRISALLSRDTDNDGVIDTWALTTFHSDFLDRALASNDASFVGIDPITGQFVNTTNTPEFMEAIAWLVYVRERRFAFDHPDIGGNWDAFIDQFNNGFGAMRSAGHYVASGQILPNLADEWGFVAFPVGPSGTGHYSFVIQNFNAIPHFFDEDTIERIMYAMVLWNRPLEGFEDDDWIFAEYARHRDPRSVDETMVNFTRNPALHRIPVTQMMPGGMPTGESFSWRVWGGVYDATQIVEEAQQVWNERIAQVNMQMGLSD